MTLAALPTPIWYPQKVLADSYNNLAYGNTVATFAATNTIIGGVVISPVTDSIAAIHFRTGAVTTGFDADVRIETVGSGGRPSGSLWSTNTNAIVTIANADDAVWKTATLTAAASVNKGEPFGIAIGYSSGSPNAQFAFAPLALQSNAGLFPAWFLNNAGAGYVGMTTNGAAEIIVEFTSGGIMYVPGCCGLDGSLASNAFNSGSSPDEYMLSFVPTVPMRVVGAAIGLSNLGAGADFTVSMWPSSSTTDADALGQITYDGDLAIATNADAYAIRDFPSAISLTAGTTYRVGVRADTANNVTLWRWNVPSGITNAMRACPWGDAAYLSTRAWSAGSAGARTDTTTSVPIIHLIVDAFDDGSGGGGGGGGGAHIIGGTIVR